MSKSRDCIVDTAHGVPDGYVPNRLIPPDHVMQNYSSPQLDPSSIPPRYADIVTRALPLLQKRLDDYGYHHCIGTAAMAQSLALIYHATGDDAYVAGLLHDWDRCILNQDIIDRARSYGMTITKEIEAAPKILHAHTGAVAVGETFPELPQSVIDAIAHHTVGVPHMSDLDKIIYIADMVEMGRSGPALETLREMVGTIELDALFLQAYERSMQHLIRNRKVLHPDTTKVWNAIILGR